jgi:hypothetical protein
MRKGVGGWLPKEEEFALVLALTKSGVTLDSYANEYLMCKPKLRKSYGTPNWSEKIMNVCGV